MANNDEILEQQVGRNTDFRDGCGKGASQCGGGSKGKMNGG